jgi:hypothetical protein
MSEALYQQALSAALNEWSELEAKEREIAFQKSRVKKTINALYTLCYPEAPQDINALSLPNAIRLIFSTTERSLSANDVRSKLEDLGFDVAKFGDNPTANILTAMRRMADNDELVGPPEDSQKGKKTFSPGPDLKAVPEVGTPLSPETVAAALKSFGFPPSVTEPNKK